MAKTIAAVYDTLANAQSAVQDLAASGISRDRIHLVTGDTEGEHLIKTAGLVGGIVGISALPESYLKGSVPDAVYRNWHQQVGQGRQVVAVQADEAQTADVTGILRRHNPIEMH